MIVAIGGGAGAGERPDERETVIDEIEGFGFISKMMLATRGGFVLIGLGRVGVVFSGLVGAGVVDIGGLGIAPGGKAAVFTTGRGLTLAAFFFVFTSRAGAVETRFGAGRNLVAAGHV